MLLKVASLYNEEPETKTAVFEIVGKQTGGNTSSLGFPSVTVVLCFVRVSLFERSDACFLPQTLC